LQPVWSEDENDRTPHFLEFVEVVFSDDDEVDAVPDTVNDGSQLDTGNQEAEKPSKAAAPARRATSTLDPEWTPPRSQKRPRSSTEQLVVRVPSTRAAAKRAKMLITAVVRDELENRVS
jgi:hypothetical protein